MKSNLTKNARWIVVWLQCQSDTPLAVPHEIVMNLGRHPYEVSVEEAMTQHLEMRDKLLAFKSYLIDVSLYPYSKQFQAVTDIATQWFKKHGADL